VAVLLFANLIELLPMTGLAALLVMVGFSLINKRRIMTVWQTGTVSRAIYGVTLVATMFLPIQIAVAIGVLMHVFVYIYREAERVRIAQLSMTADGRAVEINAPAALTSNEVTVLQPVGSLFFAGAAEFEEHLPDPSNAKNATAIIRLRDRDELGSTFIRVIDRYAQKMRETGNRLMLAGVSESALDQLKSTGVLEVIGPGNVFRAQQEMGASMREALLAAGAPQAIAVTNRLQTTERQLQQAVMLIGGEAAESIGERKARLELNRDKLTPIILDIGALITADKAPADAGIDKLRNTDNAGEERAL
jgi:SulP family sulfate permease